MTSDVVTPRHEPEVIRAKGRRYATDCNRISCKPYGKAVYHALELAEGRTERTAFPMLAASEKW